MHFIDPFLYHNALLFPIICRISYGRKIICVGVICILHGHWIISGAPSNSSFILEPKNQSKIANQVSWFRRIFWNGSWVWNHQTKTISAFQKSSTLPIQFQHCGFSVISFILIKYFQSSLFYWVSTAGNWLDSDLIPRLLENFENWKNFMIILLRVKNDAYRRFFGA